MDLIDSKPALLRLAWGETLFSNYALTLNKLLGIFFWNVILFSNIVDYNWDIPTWNWSYKIKVYSALRTLMPWCFSTRASVTTVLSMHPCVSSSIGVNSLWPSDAIWRQRSGSTLAQVMAWCLTAPSHYLNHCWLIISEVQWHSY